MEPHLFKVFGLQRTGTNLMRALVEKNFQATYLEEKETGWKHGPSRLPGGLWKGKPVAFVLCLKNPYAWALSCFQFFQRSHGGDPTMAPEFYRDPSMTFEEFLLTPSYGFATPIHRWNQMNQLWLNMLPADRTVLVKQEDQLNSQLPALQAIERILKVPRQLAQLTPIDQRVDVDVTLRGAMNTDYYQDHQYLEHYSPALLRQVNLSIEHALGARLGYEHERWSLDPRVIGPYRLFVRPCTDDAANAFETAKDPYRLLELKKRGEGVSNIVIVGAGIGALALFAMGVWPQAHILAVESDSDEFRLLRLNMRGHELITLIAGLEGAVNPISNGEPPDLLIVEDLAALNASLHRVTDQDLLRRIRFIGARLPSDAGVPELLTGLSETHRIETRSTPAGMLLIAQRLT